MSQQAAPPGAYSRTIEQIQDLVRRNTARWRRLIVLEGVGLSVAAVLGYFWLVVLLDTTLRLPVIGRLLAGLGLVACLVGLGIWLTRRWGALQLGEDQVALAIERNTPGGVQNRLINALQIGRDTRYTDHAVGQAVVQDNWRELGAVQLEQARAMRPAMLRIGLAALAVLVGAIMWVWQPASFTNAAARILLPFASIDPLYDTTLLIQPGDVHTKARELTITIQIRGKQIDQLTVLRNVDGKRSSQHIAISAGMTQVEHTFTNIERSFDYAVQGGDYTSRFFHVQVPRPPALVHVAAQMNYPAYTDLSPRDVQTNGPLEALRGTRAQLTFEFDQAVKAAAMVVRDRDGGETQLALSSINASAWRGEITFENQVEYLLQTVEAARGNAEPLRSRAMSIKPLPDREPQVHLDGLSRNAEVAVDDTLPLKINVTDDYGLSSIELVRRRILPAAPAAPEEAESWEVVQTWPGKGLSEIKLDATLSMLHLSAAEGDRMQVALRARDNDPAKSDKWTIGAVHNLVVGGEGVTLQLQYEQILASEKQLKLLYKDQRRRLSDVRQWLGKFRSNSGVKWDDPKSIKALRNAVKQLASQQTKHREQASAIARTMVEQAGALRFSLGMLADTEFERAIRIFDAVQERDNPYGMQSALSDAQLTFERIIGSLEQMSEQYVKFRKDWELAHMTAVVKMLADRQRQLAERSARYVTLKDDAETQKLRQASAQRRQQKVTEFVGLSKVAFEGLVDHVGDEQQILGSSFEAAAGSLGASELTSTLELAGKETGQGQWSLATATQTSAADKLDTIHAALRAAQAEAARQAMAALAELTKDNPDAQQAIDELLAGNLESLLSGDPDKVPMEEIIRMHEMAKNAKKHELDTNDAGADDYKWDDSMMGILYGKKPPKPDFSVLKLAEKPGGQRSFPDSSDLEGNKIALELLEDKFQDLVGDLLEEADDLRDDFETYNLSAQGQGVEEGDIGKQAGDINSVSAAAATGNQKPPTHNFGGASRTGRQGARAYGTVVGSESINRRGRDQAQEGQERAPDQAGLLKETLSDDPMKDTSTGIGGKKVDSKDTAFSTKDAGKWTDDIIGRMDKPQQVQKIVERQGDAFSADKAEQLRDLTSDQEQLIERIKSIRKDLKNLYLPTDHLDSAIAELTANLEALKESPGPEVFRRQRQALDRLTATLRVFRAARSDFQPSLPRDQQIRGRILDDPARPVHPEYEQQIKQYYEILATE